MLIYNIIISDHMIPPPIQQLIHPGLTWKSVSSSQLRNLHNGPSDVSVGKKKKHEITQKEYYSYYSYIY